MLRCRWLLLRGCDQSPPAAAAQPGGHTGGFLVQVIGGVCERAGQRAVLLKASVCLRPAAAADFLLFDSLHLPSVLLPSCPWPLLLCADPPDQPGGRAGDPGGERSPAGGGVARRLAHR